MEKIKKEKSLDDDINELLQDDVETRLKELSEKKANRKIKYKKIKRISILVILIISIVYFVSDASKVKSLSTTGNAFYNDEQIYEKAGISYNSRYIVIPAFYMQWQLEKDPFIQSASIHKELDGVIHFDVVDEPILGYMIEEDKTVAILADGTKQEIPSENLTAIANYAFIGAFSDEQLASVVESFYKLETPLDNKIIQMISEIQPYQTSYDSNMMKITMRDGNILYGPYGSARLLTYYRQTMANLKTHPACLSMDNLTSSIVAMECPSN